MCSSESMTKALVKALNDILEGRRPDDLSVFDDEVAAALDRVADRMEYLSREIAEMSPSDEMTSLAKEEVFNNVLWREFNRALRYGKPMSVALVEIDGFEELAGKHGRAAANELMQDAASVLLQMVRETDLAARYGDDRLAVIMPETSAQGAMDFGQRLRKLIGESAAGANLGMGRVTVSVGVATAPTAEVKTAPDLVERAAHALDRAKEGGRNKVAG